MLSLNYVLARHDEFCFHLFYNRECMHMEKNSKRKRGHIEKVGLSPQPLNFSLFGVFSIGEKSWFNCSYGPFSF